MQLGNVTTSVTVEANGRAISVAFPELVWAYNITLRNVTTISLPSLGSVNGSIGLYGNEFMTDFSANSLASVGGSLSFVDNADLANLSMPLLQTVGGGLQIANNTNVATISLPALQVIGGALDCNGNFSRYVGPCTLI